MICQKCSPKQWERTNLLISMTYQLKMKWNRKLVIKISQELTTKDQIFTMITSHPTRWISWLKPSMNLIWVGKQTFANCKSIINYMKKIVILNLFKLNPIQRLKFKFLEKVKTSLKWLVRRRNFKRSINLVMKFLTLKSLNSLIGEMSLGMISQVKSETKDLVVPATLSHSLQWWSLVLDLNMEKMSINSLLNSCSTVIIWLKVAKEDGLISMHTLQRMVMLLARNVLHIRAKLKVLNVQILRIANQLPKFLNLMM